MTFNPSDDTHPLSRQDRKDQTRKTLVQAALKLMEDGRSFTSLGIREIARELSRPGVVGQIHDTP